MNKIDALKHLVSLLRDDRYDSASLLLISDGRIIFGRPVYKDSDLPCRAEDLTALCDGEDGILLCCVSVKREPANIEPSLLYVPYDSISSFGIAF